MGWGGGGSDLIGNFSQIFLLFNYEASLYVEHLQKKIERGTVENFHNNYRYEGVRNTHGGPLKFAALFIAKLSTVQLSWLR